MEISESQEKKMRHACGGTPRPKNWRNYYNSGDPDPEWEDLIRKGLAVYRKVPGAGYYYHLTDAGFEAINC